MAIGLINRLITWSFKGNDLTDTVKSFRSCDDTLSLKKKKILM